MNQNGCMREKACICPNADCPRHGVCCDCIAHHIRIDDVTACMFPDSEGTRSMENFYKKLKARFEPSPGGQ